LMDAMERLADDDEKRTRMGEASARRVASLTPESWAEQFEDTMFAVINGTVR
jgi:glycosyltransferase involved in cell wall biosynthesis